MATEIPMVERMNQLLKHFGIEQAHFATRNLDDLTDLAAQNPDLFASLTMVGPSHPKRDIVSPLASRLLVFRGDTPGYDGLEEFAKSLPGAKLGILNEYEPWSDLIARHNGEIHSLMLPFLAANTTADLPQMTPTNGQYGEVAGISYNIQGSGPPLILLPLGFVPSQWDPIMPMLIEKYCTITLGGANLGITALLEKRATSEGYLGMVRSLVLEAQLQPGESVLEVGCGTGAISRWLYRYTNGNNPITAVDINRYLLREAKNIAMVEGLDGMINFEDGNAEALPYEDNNFDLVISVTVMEEVDADKVLSEMIRVTRPGGRVGVIVRAFDIPFFFNLPLSPEVKAIAENNCHGGSAGSKGCDNASLYRRFQMANLVDVKMFPHLAAFVRPWALDFFQGIILPLLNEGQKAEWHQARVQAEEEGTLFASFPHHCAVGTKPA